MRRPDRERDSEIFFWMKTPVIIITGLAVSILPAMAIITQSELGWYRVVGALLLCAICIGAPLAAREITLRSDRKNETHESTSNPSGPTPELDSSRPRDDNRSDAD